MKRVYAVEDDRAIRELVVYALSQAGYQAEGFEDGRAFREAVARALPDLVLLDVMLPGEDGFSLLRGLRSDERARAVPVLMLTARDSEMDKVRGLESGADDYVVKPFGVMELLSRVKAVLRRASPPEDARTLRLGAVELDIGRHVALADGAPLTLTPKEFELLRLLMANHGMALTRETLLDRVWGVSFAGDTRTVDMHVATLRQKLGARGGMIETVRGVGYRMEA